MHCCGFLTDELVGKIDAVRYGCYSAVISWNETVVICLVWDTAESSYSHVVCLSQSHTVVTTCSNRYSHGLWHRDSYEMTLFTPCFVTVTHRPMRLVLFCTSLWWLLMFLFSRARVSLCVCSPLSVIGDDNDDDDESTAWWCAVPLRGSIVQGSMPLTVSTLYATNSLPPNHAHSTRGY